MCYNMIDPSMSSSEEEVQHQQPTAAEQTAQFTTIRPLWTPAPAQIRGEFLINAALRFAGFSQDFGGATVVQY